MQIVADVKIALALVLLFYTTLAFSAEKQPIRLDVSALIDNPVIYDGRRVSVEAAVESDRRHAVLLVSRVPGKRGIFVELSDGAEREQSIERLLDAIYSGSNSEDVDITGVFVGVFRHFPGRSPSRVFILESVISMQQGGSGK